MTTTMVDPAPPQPPARPLMTVADKVRFVLRGIGQTLITLGLVVLLFVVYEVWITNIFAERNNNRNIAKIKNEFRTDTVDPLNLPNGGVSTVPIGSGIGILYIPRLGKDYHFAVVQGHRTPDDNDLEQGVAHYGDTQLPGQLGNFAVAGHRVGKGEPFLNIDHLRSGDPIILETKTYWYIYRVLGVPAGKNPQDVRTNLKVTNGAGQGTISLPGREIVSPNDGDVLFPVPDHTNIPVADAKDRLMTMTTCHPKFTASQRMIVYSVLAQKIPSDNSNVTQMPASVLALYGQGA